MKKVICVDDSNQPQGANAVKNTEYTIKSEYINALDQRVYIINELVNEGITRMGMRWVGYKAERFKLIENVNIEKEEHIFALN